MPSAEVTEAIESARSVHIKTDTIAEAPRKHSAQMIRALVYAVVQELPSEMTMQELCDELCIAQNQAGAQ